MYQWVQSYLKLRVAARLASDGHFYHQIRGSWRRAKANVRLWHEDPYHEPWPGQGLQRGAGDFCARSKLCSEASLYQYDRIIYMDADSFPIGSLDNLPLSS